MEQKMNNRGFVARDFVVATILFSGILALVILGVGAIANDYDNPNVINEEFAQEFERFDETTDRAGDIFDAVNDEQGLSLVQGFDLIFSSTFSVISLVFLGVTSIGGQFAGFGEFFGIPTAVTSIFFTIILSILAVLIVFIIVSSVSRRDL